MFSPLIFRKIRNQKTKEISFFLKLRLVSLIWLNISLRQFNVSVKLTEFVFTQSATGRKSESRNSSPEHKEEPLKLPPINGEKEGMEELDDYQKLVKAIEGI